MDIVCAGCGEPWDIDTVLHDEPDGFDRDGCLIRCCPCCAENKRRGLPKGLVDDLKILAEIAEMLDGDIDGFAVWCEDHWPMQLEE